MAAEWDGNPLVLSLFVKIPKSDRSLARLQISRRQQILSIVVKFTVVIGQLDLGLILRALHHGKEIVFGIGPALSFTILVDVFSLDRYSHSVRVGEDGLDASKGRFQLLRHRLRGVVEYVPRPASPLFIQEPSTKIGEECTTTRVGNLRLTNTNFEVIQDVCTKRERQKSSVSG